MDVEPGDTVRCIDASSKPEWAAWYMDNGYAEDMLAKGRRYLVRATAERDGPLPFVCRHRDPRCEEDPCPWGIARFLCNAPADDPIRALSDSIADTKGEGLTDKADQGTRD